MTSFSAQILADAEADFAFALEHCASCADYHATRPYLMLSGARRGAQRDGEMLAGLLRQYFPVGGSLLIAGSADASLLEYCLDLLGDGLGRVTVADRCPSPLHVAERSAARRGVVIATQVADLTAAAPFGRYDVILAHLILRFLSPEGRLAYLRLMRAMLRPGGRLIVVNGRNRPPGSVNDRARRVLDGLTRLGIALPEPEPAFFERLAVVLDPGQADGAPETRMTGHRFDYQQFLDEGSYAAAGLRVIEAHETTSEDAGQNWRRHYVVAEALDTD
jgi:SAM-dependent methyltransferase